MFIKITFKALFPFLRLIGSSISLSNEALLIGLGSAYRSNSLTCFGYPLNLSPQPLLEL